MRVWEYIRGKTCGYGDRKVIAGRSMTYRDLPDYTEKPDRRLRLCQGTTRAELAEAVIRCLAEGDIAVPVSKEYGEKQYAYIRSVIEGAGQGSAELKDVAMIVFTSGTTGKPKGVMLTDENIIENLEYISEYFDVRGLERLCISRSLTHISALTGELLYGICRGMTIAFYEGIFVPLRLLRFLRDNQAEVYCATPTIFGNLARYAEIRSFPVKAAAISGERLTEKQARKIAGAFPDTKFYNVYGLTEHSPRASALLPEDFVRKAGSIGKPIGRTEMRIEEGELLLRSPCVMKGYYADGERTAEKLKGGWLHTGDMAHMGIPCDRCCLEHRDGCVLYNRPYSVELGQKVRRGIRESSLKGQYTGGAVLFGYKVSDKKIYIEESEATIVRKIFEDYNNGKAIKGIRNWLNESGIRMHGGGKFTFGRVSAMLHNEKYIGRCVIQGEEYLNIYPPILDKELFETVQERLSKNAHINRFRAKKEFLLTGKLYCACCGNLITGDGGTSHTGAKYMYYKCASKKRDTRSCPSKGIRKEFLEESVYDKILETLREPGLSERLSREVTEIYNAGIEENEELKILRKQLNETDKKINNLTEAVCNGFYNKQSQEKMVELNETRDKLVTEIAKEESKERKQLSEEEVEKFLLRYRRYTDGSEESKKRLIETFVKEVIFDGVNVLIVLRTVNSTDAAKELKANSLVNPRGRAGKGDGERFYLKSERISQKNESQTEKRFSLALSGEHKRNQSELIKMNHWRYCYCMAYIAEG